MESINEEKLVSLQGTFSRRTLLKGAAALTVTAILSDAFGQQPTGAPPGTVWLYIGTYTSTGNHGQGIYLCSLDLSTGELTILRLVAPPFPSHGAKPPSTKAHSITPHP